MEQQTLTKGPSWLCWVGVGVGFGVMVGVHASRRTHCLQLQITSSYLTASSTPLTHASCVHIRTCLLPVWVFPPRPDVAALLTSMD